MINRFISILTVILFFGFFLLNPALAKENKKGIHILFPEEITKVSQLVGQDGWVTIPIGPKDWGQIDKWQAFMKTAKENKIHPILRLTSQPKGAVWQKPKLIDAVDWANFLSLLNWPDGDRWIIIFNEPNHSNEWGGQINPYEYALVLKEFSLKLHTKDSRFKILPAAMDMAAGRTDKTLPAKIFWRQVFVNLPNLNQVIDAWNSHAYPNPAFSAKPKVTKINNIASYNFELDWYQNFYRQPWLKPIFITETGWSTRFLSQKQIKTYMEYTWQQVWSVDSRIKSINWFILNGSPGPFTYFSLSTNQGLFNLWRLL